MRRTKRAISDAIATLLFGPLAPLYDVWTWIISLGRWRKWQLAALPHIQGHRVLELGCGPGHLITAIAGRDYVCYAIDNSPRMLKQANRNTTRRERAVGLVRGLAQNLPFASATFDTVVLCFSGLAWLPNVLAECRRVLRPTGLLLVVDEVTFTRTGLRTVFMRNALSLFDCETDTTPHEAPLQKAGFDVRGIEVPVGDETTRLLLGTPRRA